MDEAISDSKSHAPSKESKESPKRLDKPSPSKCEVFQSILLYSVCQIGSAVDGSSVFLWRLSSTLAQYSSTSKKSILLLAAPSTMQCFTSRPARRAHNWPFVILRSHYDGASDRTVLLPGPPPLLRQACPSHSSPSPCTADPSVWVGSLCSSLV